MKRVLITLASISLTLGFLNSPAAADAPSPPAQQRQQSVSTGLSNTPAPAKKTTTPKYDYEGAIRESVWVEAPDLDGNGEPDRIAADIIRPRELDGKKRVPVVMDASPYYSCCGRGNESEKKRYDGRGLPTKFPLFYDNYFVPRGYAYIAVDMAGTSRSTGCTDQGAASDIESVKAVVDWLNGRARGFNRNDKPVSADWSDGKVGMIGKSYDGTLANGVAATGVEGLETIVPIAAISSWYDYDRYQGLPFSYDYPTYLSEYVAGDRADDIDCSARLEQMARDDGDETGEYTDFWKARDYRDGDDYNAANVNASVFVMHGLQDFNVKTPNFSRWWKDLGKHGVKRKLWLTRAGHADPFDSSRKRWVRTLHRWFDRELMGIRNGIDREPRVHAQIKHNRWVTSSDWPITNRTVKLRPQSDGGLARGRPDDATTTFENAPQQREADALKTGDNPNRLLFSTEPLADRVRISGTPKVRLDVEHGAETGQIGVKLVDYGKARRVVDSNDGVRNLDTESCWGASIADDDSCYTDVALNVKRTPLQVLSRGWARLNEQDDRVTVELTANDVVVPKGHRLGLVVVGASRDWVVTVDDAKTGYGVNLRRSVLRLPTASKVRTNASKRTRPPEVNRIPRRAIVDPDTFEFR